MKTNDTAIFSLRIVSIDNYMKAPLFGLDSCYSDYRAEEIKQVPVIRIFGTDANGTKTCAHIHGVFPYLYVPCAAGDSANDTDRTAYQLASSLDKAINISLGQANSNTQHIFKVVLVKAKPFYGYHKSVHKFYKIFFYNPAFIRRAANLLQNGAILGQIFQPHESHVPYMLQFMIDYNLYGMSFLYVPNKTVQYRQQSHKTGGNGIDDDFDDEVLSKIDDNQILDQKIERMSTSKQEIDINATLILNRFQVAMNDEENEHANPGIAFLWSDERGRRSKMTNNPPPLVVTQECTQDRGVIPTTESEIFHQAALDRRLEQLSADSPSTQSSDSSRFLNQTLNRSNANRKFNLNQFLQNSVYPTECTQNEIKPASNQSILDASFLIDHLKSSKVPDQRSSNDSPSIQSQSFDPNETFVDEELVLNLTQKLSNATLLNETLNAHENEVLDIFEMLEEDEPSHDDTLRIDADSDLAPLTQHSKDQTQFSQSQPKQTTNSEQVTSFDDVDSDDDLLNQFSMSIIDCLPDEQEQTAELKIPQFDGAIDSPTKKTSLKKGTLKPNARSPSRSAKKYAPLDIMITKSPALNTNTSLDIRPNIPFKVPRLCLEKCDADVSRLSKTFTIAKSISDNAAKKTPSISSPCPKSKREGERKPSVEVEQQECASDINIIEKYSEILKNSPFVKLTKNDNIEELINRNKSTIQLSRLSPSNSKNTKADMQMSEKVQRQWSDDDIIETTPEPDSPPPERRYPKRIRKPRSDLLCYHTKFSSKNAKHKILPPDEYDDIHKLDTLYSWYKWSDCKLALQYDKERNFYPQPGPSHLNYYEDDDLTGYYIPFKASKSVTKSDSKFKKRANDTSTGKPSSKKTKMQNTSNEHDIDIPAAKKMVSPTYSNDSDWEDDVHIQSFYEQSFIKDSPTANTQQSPSDCRFSISDSPGCNQLSSAANDTLVNTTIATPILSKLEKNIKCCASEEKPKKTIPNKVTTDRCTLKFIENIPHPKDIEKALDLHELPKVIHPIPYYSDPNDIIIETNKKEVGHTVLQLAGNAVNDCEDFKSQMNLAGMQKWQKTIGMRSHRGLRARDNKSLDDPNNIRQLLAKEEKIQIAPTEHPPDYLRARKWLKLRTKTNEKKRTSAHCNDEINGVIDTNENPAKIPCNNITTNKRINKQADKSHGNQDIKQNGIKTDYVNELLLNKDITVRRIRTRQSQQICCKDTPVQLINDSDDDDVICLDDILPTNHTNGHSFSQLPEKNLDSSDAKANLNLEDTIAAVNSTDTSFGIRGGPMENSFGFRMNLENFQCAKSNIEHNYLTILSLEIHCQTRSTLQPDPQYDEIVCIFFEIHNDVPDQSELNSTILAQQATGILINTNKYPDFGQFRLATQMPMIFVNNETELFQELVTLIRKWDPDIFAGYEIELVSWGYVIQRSQAINFDLVPQISRIPSQKVAKFKPTDDEINQQDAFIGFEYDSEYKLHGRILLDVWRLLRGEIALTSYSFENIMYHVMHRRCPAYSYEKLTRLWNESINRWIVIEYYISRVKGTLEILNQLDLVSRTCELAKLFGIQFYEVLSRGSQFRVESMMLRIAKPKNLIPISPSVQQRAHMRSPEYLALILEPHSRLYSDPLIVLDFQSLYPSMIIAYNYCFSTCLGRVEHLGQSQPFEMGAWQLRVPRRLIEKLSNEKLITISPCGVVFVKSSVREGVLPRMLREILDTRLMVKQSMKLHKNDKLLQRILHSRQLGLKLMANVTYGYTAANFSGRMPCVEVGDSVVSKGRETLERAIKTVESNERWGCRVVYGDTDSLFVLVPGRSRQEAFDIGSEIAETVTKQNPFPVRLKLEKVYHPSILQTKKRYVGYMYETPDQPTPTYEAKGIETVRRDGCPAVAKVLEKTLRILFETCDVSAVKSYVCKQFTKILSGKANIQDLIFAKEFRGVNGYKPGACVPSLELTRAALQVDRRAEPRRGERVPYLVINGPPGVPLIRLVRSPHEYLANEGFKINAIYYVTKVLIPPINRCLLLIGADANQWFADLPRKSQYALSLDVASNILNYANQSAGSSMDKSLVMGVSGASNTTAKKSTISQYFSTTNCVCDCGEHTQNGICSSCLKPRRIQQSVLILNDKCMQLERKLNLCLEMCSTCCGQLVDSKCKSLDCSVLFMLNRWKRESKQIHFYRQLLDKHF